MGRWGRGFTIKRGSRVDYGMMGEGLHHKEGIMHIFSSLQSLRGRVSDLEKIESQLIRSDHRIQAS